MFNSVTLLFITILYGVLLVKLRKRIDELEFDVYSNRDNTHYPAIKNEFASVWRAIDELTPDGEEGEEDEEY